MWYNNTISVKEVKINEVNGADEISLRTQGADLSKRQALVIATSDNPRTEDPEFILSEVEAGVLPALHGNFHEKITDRRTAIFRAIELAQKDDIVLIAGKGHENYQILKTGTIHFDDKEVAIEAIRGKING